MADQIFDSLPMAISNRYIAAAVIIALSLLAAFIIDFIVARVFRVLARRTKAAADDVLIDMIHGPVRTTVVLLGLAVATLRLELPATGSAVVMSILRTIAILVWTVFAFRLVNIIIMNLTRMDSVKLVGSSTAPLFSNLAKLVVFAGAVYLIFLAWQIDVTAWLASAGIVGIAVGFAARDTLANLFAGIFILADAPYKVGEYINLDTGERGEVTHIGLRSTRLLTRDDVEVTIPNAAIAAAKIVNESSGRWTKQRIRVPVGVAYGSDVDRLKELLVEIGREYPDTCKEPDPRVRFRRFGDSSLDFELLCWIEDPVLRGSVIDGLTTEIYKKLAEERIEIPYPKRDVYIREMPPGVLDKK